MRRTLADIIADLPEGRRRKIEKRAQDLIAEEVTLQGLRRAKERTQAAMARKLRIGQDSVSRLEQRSDMLISTLKGYIGALGGELHLVARFPGGTPVELAGLGSGPRRRATPERRASRLKAAVK
jgi:hypothetical protein